MDELRELLLRHARPDLRTGIDGVLILRADRPYPPAATTYGKVFALVAQGLKRCAIGDRVYDYGPGQFLVTSIELPVTSYFHRLEPGRPGLGVGFELDPTMVAELAAHRPEGAGHDPDPQPGAAVSTASGDLLDAVVRLLRLLDRPEDIAALAPLIQREIVWRLLTGEQGRLVRQLGLPGTSFGHVARAVRWIREHHAERFLVEDLARDAGMSVSAFHRNFQAVTAMSPIQFQKQIRLQQARLYLAADPHDVAAVSRRVGYESASQFSREYRRQFGVPPSQEAPRLTLSTRPR